MDPAIATFALEVGKTLLSANAQASANRATMAGNKSAIKRIDKSLGLIPEVAVSKQELARDEFAYGFDLTGQQSSTLYDDLYRKEDMLGGAQKFAHSGAVENELSILTDKLNKDFLYKYKGLHRALDKEFAKIEEWKFQEQEQLKTEKFKLEQENRRLGKTDSFFEALGLSF